MKGFGLYKSTVSWAEYYVASYTQISSGQSGETMCGFHLGIFGNHIIQIWKLMMTS